MSRRMITAGTYLCYAVETSAGTRPTSGYTKIPEIKSMPSFNPAPDQIESTTLDETEFKTYEEGLKDLGGVLEFTANMTEDLDTLWTNVNTAYESAASASKAMWFAIVNPKLTKATFFKGDPAPIGIDQVGTNAMLETTLHITPVSAPVRDTKPTLAT